MSANVTLDQVGLPGGTVNEARSDGLDTGAVMSATVSGYVSTHRAELLWVAQHPSPDTTSVATFVAVGANGYSWTPTAGRYGTWILHVVTDEGTADEDECFLGFAVLSSPTALRIPAPQERGDPFASLVLATAVQKRLSWFNEPEVAGPFAGAGGMWAPWWRPHADMIHIFNTSGGAPVPSSRLINTTAPLAGGGNLSADRTLSITAATTIAAGSMSAADKLKLDGLPSSAVPTTRLINVTAPITGGGDLSADRTIGISAATTIASGSMSASDKTKLDGIATGAAAVTSSAPANVTKAAASAGAATDAARADHKHDISTAAVSTIGTGNTEGTATSLARSDHVHDHGAQTSGTLHAAATTSVAGFMSAADKTKLDAMQNALAFVTASGTTKTGGLSDAYTVQECTNVAGIAWTIPTNAAIPYDVGTVISLIQENTGQITIDDSGIVGAGGVLNSSGAEKKSARLWAEIFLKKTGTNTWHMTGEKAV